VQYEVEVNGRVRRVSLHRTGGRFAVSIDGRTRLVDAARVDGNNGARTWSLIIEPGASYDVGIVSDGSTGMLDVRIGGVACAVALNGRTRHGRLDEHEKGLGPQRIVAPMPGKIVRVAVTPGSAVLARQTVVVIEAMKMENELRSGRDGTVGELHAREGALVEAGELLVVIR
jgi:3-methylcrotonyl-CoA carboxylase alpha subunit